MVVLSSIMILVLLFPFFLLSQHLNVSVLNVPLTPGGIAREFLLLIADA